MPSCLILFQLFFLLPRTQILTFSCRQNYLWCYTVNKSSDVKQVKNLLSTLKKKASSQKQEFLRLLLLPSLFDHGNIVLVLAFPQLYHFSPI